MLATDAKFTSRSAKRKQWQMKRERFAHSRRAEAQFARQLTKIAEQIGAIVNGSAPDGQVRDEAALNSALRQYSKLITPWAKTVTERMLYEVDARDKKAWREAANDMGVALRQELGSAPTGAALQLLLNEQVRLITSLPLRAAQRVHDLTQEALIDSSRAADIAKEISKSGHVTEGWAKTIARTEVARTSSVLVQVRAQRVGSEGYIWRTSEDSDVRKSHKKMEGKFVRWDSPPTLSDGTTTHAGMIYNCRCWADPVIPDKV